MPFWLAKLSVSPRTKPLLIDTVALDRLPPLSRSLTVSVPERYRRTAADEVCVRVGDHARRDMHGVERARGQGRVRDTVIRHPADGATRVAAAARWVAVAGAEAVGDRVERRLVARDGGGAAQRQHAAHGVVATGYPILVAEGERIAGGEAAADRR